MCIHYRYLHDLCLVKVWFVRRVSYINCYLSCKMYLSKTISNVFFGCCASAFLMEILISKSPESANLITVSQFLFIALQGVIFTSKFGTVRSKIPLKQYFILVALFFITSVANNYVYALHVPSTLHMIIRSASSPASMLVSWYAKKRVPNLFKAIGSILISIGVAIAMYGGATVADQEGGHFLSWCIGVAILLATLITGAYTGLQQELLYAKYGKHPKEMLFYTHALPLPLFIGMYPQLKTTAMSLETTSYILLAINILSQFYCTNSVHALATKETSVTITLILTLRKFVSLLISSIVFKNNITVLHVVGCALVIVGTFIYFDGFSRRRQRPVNSKEWKNK